MSICVTSAAVVLIVFALIVIIVTIRVDDGIISDPALIFLFSSLALYLSVFEDNNRSNNNSK